MRIGTENISPMKMRTLQLMGVLLVVLFGFPKLSVKLGPIPFYFIDFLLVITFFYSGSIKNIRFSTPFEKFIGGIMFFIIISEILSGIEMGTLMQPIYLILRYLIAASIFFSLTRVVSSREELLYLLNYAVVGALLTAMLLIMSSLSFTRSYANFVFSLPFLEPAYARVSDLFSQEDGVLRGRSLIGVSILSAAFLNTIWPLLLYARGKKAFRRQKLLMFTSLIVPFAILFTYSRGTIIALIVVIIGVLIYSDLRAKRLLLAVSCISIIVLTWVGWDSEYFFFERIERRTTAMLNDPYSDSRETERLFAYTEPFEHLAEHPTFLFLGQGFARQKVRGHNLREGYGKATHAVFAAAYYSYGMAASLLLVFMIIKALDFTFKMVRRHNSNFSKALIPSIMGFIPWFILGHAAVSNVRGSILMFFLIGIVALQKKFIILDQHVNRNHTAV